MNEERKMILDMLKEGKISVDQASDLLSALGKEKENKEDGFINKLSSSFEKIMKKTGETISNIDLSNLDINFDPTNIPGNIYRINSNQVENETRIEDNITSIDIDIANGNLEIQRAQDNFISVYQKVYFKHKEDEKKEYLSVNVDGETLSIKTNKDYKGLEASVDVKVYLGKNLYDKLNANLVNGSAEICDVDFQNANIEDVNGKISLINSAGDIAIKNINGKIEVKNTNGNVSAENINGSVYLTNIAGPMADIDVINGSIRVDGLNSESLKANSKAGTIRVGKISSAKEINLNTGFGSIVVDSEGYDKQISATIKSRNYSISDKFKNKIQREDGYQISTDPEKTDLNIDVKSGFGRITIR